MHFFQQFLMKLAPYTKVTTSQSSLQQVTYKICPWGPLGFMIPIVVDQNSLIGKVHQWTSICEVVWKTLPVGVFSVYNQLRLLEALFYCLSILSNIPRTNCIKYPCLGQDFLID